MFKRILSLSVIVCFFLTTIGPYPQAHADSVLGLPAPGTMINLSPAYEPVIIKGLTIHKDNPFLFDFIVDVGQDKMSGGPLKKEGEKLIKYFLAGLAIPDKDLWVNLSPYEKNKMVPEALGQTDMGRDLLEQDYILKQITASLIYPEKQLGKTFWDKVYAKAQEMYGTTQVPVNTFNKVWIMADRAEVFEHNQTAFVVDQHLKVMLEEDYLALQKHVSLRGAEGDAAILKGTTHTFSSQIVRSIILPELEKEVNTGKNFANLRQIFNSIILSSWYKKNLKEALLNQVYANKSKVNGVIASGAKQSREEIYEQYLEAYKKGVFNYIKEDINTAGETIPRKYFSGGFRAGAAADPALTTDQATLANSLPVPDRDLFSFRTAFYAPGLNKAKKMPASPLSAPENIFQQLLGRFNRMEEYKRKHGMRESQLLTKTYYGLRDKMDDTQKDVWVHVRSILIGNSKKYLSINNKTYYLAHLLHIPEDDPRLTALLQDWSEQREINKAILDRYILGLAALYMPYRPDIERVIEFQKFSSEQTVFPEKDVFAVMDIIERKLPMVLKGLNKENIFLDTNELLDRTFKHRVSILYALESIAPEGLGFKVVNGAGRISIPEVKRDDFLDWLSEKRKSYEPVKFDLENLNEAETDALYGEIKEITSKNKDWYLGISIITINGKTADRLTVRRKYVKALITLLKENGLASVAKAIEKQNSFDAAMLSHPDRAMNVAGQSLAEQVEKAWSAETAEDFIGNIHNEYLVDSQERLEALARFLKELDPYFTNKIMRPERMTSQWEKIYLVNAEGEEYPVDLFGVRVANDFARGVPKGGLRAILNYLDENADTRQTRTASDLMREPAFKDAFAKLNQLLKKSTESSKVKEAHVRSFLQKWIEEDAQALSMWMSFKTSVIGLPLGGGKGVFFVGQIREDIDSLGRPRGTFSIEDTELWRNKDQRNIATIARHYVNILYPDKVGPDIDVPAPDKGTDHVFMGFATDEYILLNLEKNVIRERDQVLDERLNQVLEAERAKNKGRYPLTSTALVEEASKYLHETHHPVPELAVFTGKKLEHGGVVGRTEATGFGNQSIIRSLFDALGEDFRGKTMAFHGAGNVALYSALQAVRDGGIVRVLSDEGITLIKESGFSEDEILELIKYFEMPEKFQMYQIWQKVIKDEKSVVAVVGEGKNAAEQRLNAVLDADVDIFSPCATEGVITEANAGRIKAKYIVSGANGPITPGALKILIELGKTVVPDTLANSRGVMVSYFEQVQALTGYIFTPEEVDLIGERIHKAAFSAVWAESQKSKVSLTEAADIVSAKGIIRAQYLDLIKKYNGELKEISKARGYNESTEQLQKQIAASGLSAHLEAIQKNSLEIKVMGPSPKQNKDYEDALKEADVVIAGSSVAEGTLPEQFGIPAALLKLRGKIYIDPIIMGERGVIKGNNRLTTPNNPAYLDENWNLIFTVENLPAMFGSIASKMFGSIASNRLSRVTQDLTRELLERSAENESGVRSGIVTADGHFVSTGTLRDEKFQLTKEKFEKVMEGKEKRTTVGVPVELTKGETRVAMTPKEVKQLVRQGYKVLVEIGAGARSQIPDMLYEEAGATMATQAEVWNESDVIRKVKAPLPEEFVYFRKGLVIEAFLYLTRSGSFELKEALKKSEVTAVAYEEVKKTGYRPLHDRVFNIEDVGAQEDQGRYILDPIRGSADALLAALYYSRDAHLYRKWVDDRTHVINTSKVDDRKIPFDKFVEEIKKNLEAFNHNYEFPQEMLDTWMSNRIGHVVILGGTKTARAAALDSLLYRAKNVTIFVSTPEEKRLLELQFRKDGLLRLNQQPINENKAMIAAGNEEFDYNQVVSVMRHVIDSFKYRWTIAPNGQVYLSLAVYDPKIPFQSIVQRLAKGMRTSITTSEYGLYFPNGSQKQFIKEWENKLNLIIKTHQIIVAIAKKYHSDFQFLGPQRTAAVQQTLAELLEGNIDRGNAHSQMSEIYLAGGMPKPWSQSENVLDTAGSMLSAWIKNPEGRIDLAMTVMPEPVQKSDVGGIDLNTSNGMQWKISKDGRGVEMNIDPAMLERIRREGIDSLSPVIFRITPITSIWPLVGLPAPVK